MNKFNYRLFVLTLLAFCFPATGNGDLQAQSSQPLKSILRADGSIDVSREFAGSLDPQGYKMTLTPSGAPRFVAVTASSADPGDVNWDDNWQANGPTGTVRAIAKYGSDIVVGGYFAAGAPGAVSIARFDGYRWYGLSTGMSDFSNVLALAVLGTDLYAGGDFTSAGGDTSIKYIAKWNGTSWSKVGSGISNIVQALAVWNGSLYVGGSFTSAGGKPIKYLGKWDGSVWDSVGTTRFTVSSTSPGVYALAVANNKLHLGGHFERIGGKLMNNIAVYNGTSFDSLGTATQVGVVGGSSNVYAIAVSGSTIYAGGDFSVAGPVSNARSIARWTGTAWDTLGFGLFYRDGNGTVQRAWCYSLGVLGTDLYAGGLFGGAGSADAQGIAKWNGSSWSIVGGSNGLNNNTGLVTFGALCVDGASLYIGGDFAYVGSSGPGPGALRWDGSRWYSLGNGIRTGNVATLALHNNQVVAGGNFAGTGGAAGSVIRWDGTTWNGYNPLANTGSSNPINAIAVSGANLYVGGNFTSINGVAANYIAVWNGSTWAPLGAGTDDYITSLVARNDTVYAGGVFTSAGGAPASRIARWDGSTWSALGSGMNSYVATLAFMGNSLYAGGAFTQAGGTVVNYIARWSGGAWSALRFGTATGVNNGVAALHVIGTDLYAGGAFDKIGNMTVNGIAKWDGTDWTPLGTGLKFLNFGTGYVNALTSRGSDLIVGGSFSTGLTNGDTLNNIAIWNGADWTKLGSGISIDNNGQVLALVVKGNEIYAGGSFGLAGGKLSGKIALWNKPLTTPPQTVLSSPGDNATGFFVNGSFTWQPAGDAAVYAFQVATDSLFTSVVASDTAVIGVARKVSGLPPSTKLFWRVRSKNTAGVGPYSVVSRVTTAVNPPSVPVLVSPTNNSTNQSTRTTFTWNSTGGPTFFQLQVSTDSTFLQLASISVDDSAIATTSSDRSVSTSTKFFWRVRAKNSGGWSAWSSASNYTTASIQAPLAPSLSTPADNATNQSRTLSLSWGSVSSTTFYRLQVSTDSLFGSTFFNDTSLSTSKQVASMAASTKYFWRVNASNAGGAGFWSVVRRFTTTAATGVDGVDGVPTVFALLQNYPNPFNPSTTIQFEIPYETHVRLGIFDILGREVANLLDEQKSAGRYRIQWRVAELSSGVYFYRIEAGQFVDMRKLVFVK